MMKNHFCYVFTQPYHLVVVEPLQSICVHQSHVFMVIIFDLKKRYLFLCDFYSLIIMTKLFSMLNRFYLLELSHTEKKKRLLKNVFQATWFPCKTQGLYHDVACSKSNPLIVNFLSKYLTNSIRIEFKVQKEEKGKW